MLDSSQEDLSPKLSRPNAVSLVKHRRDSNQIYRGETWIKPRPTHDVAVAYDVEILWFPSFLILHSMQSSIVTPVVLAFQAFSDPATASVVRKGILVEAVLELKCFAS